MHHHEPRAHQAGPGVASDILRGLAMDKWVDVRSLGVKGDGGTDDTAALQAAINNNQSIFPSGMYASPVSINTQTQHCTIGFNPVTTQLTLLNDSAEFRAKERPIVIDRARMARTLSLESAISTGLGNPRAGGVLWMGGSKIHARDMTIIPGHTPHCSLVASAPSARADRCAQIATYFDRRTRIMVKDEAAGIFRGNWTHGSFAKAGLRVETRLPQHHLPTFERAHIHVEVEFHNAQKLDGLTALQPKKKICRRRRRGA